MYVPQAKQLTHGGFFVRHEASGQWDTAECAKLMMHYLVVGNPGRVDEVRASWRRRCAWLWWKAGVVGRGGGVGSQEAGRGSGL